MMSLNGFINLDKPLHMSSAQAVDRVKRILSSSARPSRAGDLEQVAQDPRTREARPRMTKIGHAGTLDPLASGVLVLALGEATKLVGYAQDAPKEYEFTVTWGEERSTDDAEGEVVATADKRPTLAEIEAILPTFTGDIMQAPPAYSAIKMGGKRAYAMARAGEVVEMKERVVRVFSLSRAKPSDLSQVEKDPSTPLRSAQDKENTTTFLVACGKGTYIRSLARDMGRIFGVYGYVSMLRRTAVGKFAVEDAISLEKLEVLVHKGDLGFIKPPITVLDDILAYRVNEAEAAQLKRGQWLSKPTSLASDMVIACVFGEALIAIARTDAGFVKPERVFNIS